MLARSFYGLLSLSLIYIFINYTCIDPYLYTLQKTDSFVSLSPAKYFLSHGAPDVVFFSAVCSVWFNERCRFRPGFVQALSAGRNRNAMTLLSV